jgi:hypothetical protein
MTDIKYIENSQLHHNFICEKCDFKCSKKGDYNRHLATQKHIILTSDLSEYIIKKYSCICGKDYKHNQSLYTHKKTCQTLVQNESTNKMIEILKQNNVLLIQNHDLKEVIIEQKEVILEQKEIILEQKEERKEVTILLKKVEQNGEEQIEHNKKVLEIAEQNGEEQLEYNKKMIEIAQEQKELMEHIKEKGISNITNIQNQTNHFNLNNFLNVTCKDAMNIEDVQKKLKQYVITNEQIAFFENGSHVLGICNIIDSFFASIPIVERPVHCSDLKREILHWKNSHGEWEKEDDSGIRPNEKTFMQCINGYTFNKTIKWKDEALDTNNNDKDDAKYNKVLSNMIGPLSNPEKQVIIKGKIRNHIAKKTLIGKVEGL